MIDKIADNIIEIESLFTEIYISINSNSLNENCYENLISKQFELMRLLSIEKLNVDLIKSNVNSILYNVDFIELYNNKFEVIKRSIILAKKKIMDLYEEIIVSKIINLDKLIETLGEIEVIKIITLKLTNLC